LSVLRLTPLRASQAPRTASYAPRLCVTAVRLCPRLSRGHRRRFLLGIGETPASLSGSVWRAALTRETSATSRALQKAGRIPVARWLRHRTHRATRHQQAGRSPFVAERSGVSGTCRGYAPGRMTRRSLRPAGAPLRTHPRARGATRACGPLQNAPRPHARGARGAQSHPLGLRCPSSPRLPEPATFSGGQDTPVGRGFPRRVRVASSVVVLAIELVGSPLGSMRGPQLDLCVSLLGRSAPSMRVSGAPPSYCDRLTRCNRHRPAQDSERQGVLGPEVRRAEEQTTVKSPAPCQGVLSVRRIVTTPRSGERRVSEP